MWCRSSWPRLIGLQANAPAWPPIWISCAPTRRFVAEDAYRRHYADVADGYAVSLEQAFGRGEVSAGDWQVRAWAIMGMNVFLGLKYGVWDEGRPAAEIAAAAHALIADGLAPR
jgi:hypothetical protein